MIIQATEELDQEWVELILDALNSGISPDEIRMFLSESKKRSALAERKQASA